LLCSVLLNFYENNFKSSYLSVCLSCLGSSKGFLIYKNINLLGLALLKLLIVQFFKKISNKLQRDFIVVFTCIHIMYFDQILPVFYSFFFFLSVRLGFELRALSFAEQVIYHFVLLVLNALQPHPPFQQFSVGFIVFVQ
jgi:hypothetical protein